MKHFDLLKWTLNSMRMCISIDKLSDTDFEKTFQEYIVCYKIQNNVPFFPIIPNKFH